MPLIVEDGTGLANANSYASVAEADAYWADRPSRGAAWDDADAEQKEEALVGATAYLDAEHGDEWVGDKATGDQALDWPRTGAVTASGHALASNAVPARLKKAAIEAAILSSPIAGGVDLLAKVDSPAAGIKRTRDKVDVLETEVEYSGSGADQRPDLPAVDGLVADLIVASGYTSRVRG